jgi:hypothetical protein
MPTSGHQNSDVYSYYARARTPDKFRLAYPRIKPNPQRYQFSEEPEIYLRCTTLDELSINSAAQNTILLFSYDIIMIAATTNYLQNK